MWQGCSRERLEEESDGARKLEQDLSVAVAFSFCPVRNSSVSKLEVA